jgi:hypothetical protein
MECRISPRTFYVKRADAANDDRQEMNRMSRNLPADVQGRLYVSIKELMQVRLCNGFPSMSA